MFSKTARPGMRSAAWRISLWSTLAYTLGAIVIFLFLDRFVARDIQQRTDAWLTGEVEVLGDVAAHTPKDALYNRVVGEVAELASREVPNRTPTLSSQNDSVFFLQTGSDGSLKLWVGVGDGQADLKAIHGLRRNSTTPSDVHVDGFTVPFRVASTTLADGSRVYLGLSVRDEERVIQNLRVRFLALWIALILLGFAIVFYATRRTLRYVRRITEAASHIGELDLKTRVPTSENNDEMAQLAYTLNHMLDRIENAVRQLHTITDSLAHDLRSPLTAIRGKLETSLVKADDGERQEAIASAIEELDSLADLLNESLDVAEARADALRLTPTVIDLEQLVRSMAELYEPSMTERGLVVRLRLSGPLLIKADQGLMHRMLANLFDNELKHLPSGSSITIFLEEHEGSAVLRIQDDGPGFDAELLPSLFQQRTRGKQSQGHGLGLAFVNAVVHAHAGHLTAFNGLKGGIEIEVRLPCAPIAELSQHISV
ncbi:MAG: HAMP domain-containing protein [Acidobacteriota bacterium]|nr:HAMP domain-containing protein [Acidobacteriota bacterium]